MRFTSSGSIFFIPIICKNSLPKTISARSIGLTPLSEVLKTELIFEKISKTKMESTIGKNEM